MREENTQNLNKTIDLSEMNRSRVLKLIYKYSGITRAEIANLTGLTEAGISKIVSSLIRAGVVRNGDYVSGKMGRRAIGLEINTSKFEVLAMKLTRSELMVAVFTLSSELVVQETIKINRESESDFILELMSQKIQEYVAKYSFIRAIGVSVPGPFDSMANKILGVTRFGKFNQIDLNALFNLDVDLPIYLIHDANAGVMAEWLLNEEYYIEDSTLAYYLVGEGVGLGIISNGKILEGERGIAAEIGHVSINFQGGQCNCGNIGCLELYCSALQFVDRAKSLAATFPNSSISYLDEISPQNIFKLAEEGDELAIKLTKEVGRYIGLGAVNIVNAYAPKEIIIGDVMANGGDILLNEVKSLVDERSFSGLAYKVNIRYEDKDVDRILLGAASIAIDNCLENVELLESISLAN